ncbi:MAG: hypothetical protein HYZ26_06980 [Chloroflexi bacterium]|nr:hypothetical protein [Chloroflexota bacterium]
MTFPSLLFGALLASLYGAVFHFWQGGGPGRLAGYLIASWAGFWSGHAIAAALGWSIGRLGALNVGIASLGSAVALVLVMWLGRGAAVND